MDNKKVALPKRRDFLNIYRLITRQSESRRDPNS